MPKKISKAVSRKPVSRKKKPTVANMQERPSSPVFFSYLNYQKIMRSIKIFFALFKLRSTVKIKNILSSLNTKAQREVTYFKDSSFPVTFKPFLYKQGLAVFLFLAIITSFLLPPPIVDQKLVISSAVTKQNTTVVAGGSNIKWTTLLKKSDIANGKFLLSLPKSAKNIKVSTISKQQADIILQSTKVEQVSQKQRQSIAISNQPKSFYMASILDNMSDFMLSSLDNAVEVVIDATNDQIQTTEDAIVVNLSSEAPASAEGSGEAMPVAEQPAVEPAQSPEVIEAGEPTEQPVTPPIDEVVLVEYETPAPEVTEQETDTGKIVTVSSEEQVQDPALEQVPLTNVLAFTNIPEIYKVGQESKIKIKWTNNDNKNVTFKAYDTNNNG
ncbi:MAG: hypothetical protein WCK10_02630, partial [Candidatus Staskawiczbacteria bacterium]